MNWYLKKANDETVYGPVDEKNLEAWAADGRVAPDDLVSPDRRQWKPASQVPGLNMEWIVELAGGGQYGPLHALALRELVRGGDLQPDTRTRSSVTGQTSSVAAVLLPYLLAAEEKTAVKEPAPADRVEADAKARQAAAELKALKDQLLQTAQERDQARQRAEEAERQIREGKDKSALAEAASRKAIEQLAAAQGAATELKAARDQVTQARREAERLRREGDQQARQAAAELKALQEEWARAREEKDQALQRAEQASAALELAGKEMADARGTIRRQAAEGQAAAAQLATAKAAIENWKTLFERARAAAEAEKARLAAKTQPAEAPAMVPRELLEEAQRRIAHLERSYKQAMQTLHRNLAARIGESQVTPPDQLWRRDIA